MASRKRIVICYILLQSSFWGMLSSICAYQAAVVLDRGFTAGQAGIFCALCYFASLFTQPVIGGWADRHPEVPLKRLLIVMLLPAIALNLVFYFTRPNFLLTALTFFLFGVLETNSYPLIDSMGMQYVNAGVQIPYSLSRGIGSLSYALLCVATGLLTARFGMQTALLAHCAEQLVMLVCLLLFPSIPAQLLPQPQKGAAEGHSALQILRGSRTFTLMLIACFFGMMGVMPISGFLVTLVTSRGGDSRALGLAQFLMAASELPSALVFGLLRRRLSSAKILLISIVFMAVKPLLILASGSLGMLLAVQPVQMLGYGLFFPASVYFANESVAPADRVQGQSLRTIVAISLSTLLGSLVSGYLLDLGGTTLMLWFSAGCAAVGTAVGLAALVVVGRHDLAVADEDLRMVGADKDVAAAEPVLGEIVPFEAGPAERGALARGVEPGVPDLVAGLVQRIPDEAGAVEVGRAVAAVVVAMTVVLGDVLGDLHVVVLRHRRVGHDGRRVPALRLRRAGGGAALLLDGAAHDAAQ